MFKTDIIINIPLPLVGNISLVGQALPIQKCLNPEYQKKEDHVD